MSQPQVMGRRSGRRVISGSRSDNKKGILLLFAVAVRASLTWSLCGDGRRIDGRGGGSHTSPDHIYNNMNLSVGAEIVNE